MIRLRILVVAGVVAVVAAVAATAVALGDVDDTDPVSTTTVTVPATGAPDSPVTAPPADPAVPDAAVPVVEHLAPETGLVDARAAVIDSVVATADPQRLLVTFTAGVTECEGLDRVVVTETTEVVRLTVYTATRPPADRVCIEIARTYATEVVLGQPLGGRAVVDGSRSPVDAAASSAEEVARAAFTAWRTGDDATLRSLATPEAADAAIAARAVGGDGWSFARCDGAAGSLYCTWTRGAQVLTERVSNVEPTHRLTELTVG